MVNYQRSSRYPNEDQEIKKSEFEKYQDFLDDHDGKYSLSGHSPAEFDEGLALDYHEDSYSPIELSKIHTDIELEKVIKELLLNSKKIDASDICISVDKSNVKLAGSVHSQLERDYVVSLVKLVHGVGNINSELIVKINPGILPTDVGRNPG